MPVYSETLSRLTPPVDLWRGTSIAEALALFARGKPRRASPGKQAFVRKEAFCRSQQGDAQPPSNDRKCLALRNKGVNGEKDEVQAVRQEYETKVFTCITGFLLKERNNFGPDC